MRAFTNIEEIAAEATTNMRALYAAMEPTPESEEAFAWLETFVAVSLRVIQKSNPSKVREATRTEWIRGLIDGKPQVQPKA
jgi:hypothetical protein